MSVAPPDALAVWSFDAIGTRWEIETAGALPAGTQDEIRARIADFDRTWSRFRADSLVSQLAAAPVAAAETGVASPRDAHAMLEVYRELSEATNGAVNPLVGEALARRGYDRDYTFVDRGAEPSPTAWTDLVRWSGGRLHAPVGRVVDVGAVGKGRLVDLVHEIVCRDASGRVVVDASGDLSARGGPVRVGLEHPYDARRAIGVFEVTDAALCASATNRRAWGEGLHHVLDARTGEPVHRIAATWAVAADALHADAAATALFFDGGPELAASWGVDWVRMTTDGRLEWAPGSRAELFS